SPYMYCGGNPVRLVDVDGREWLEPIDVEKCNELRKRAVAERGNYKEGSDEYNRIQEGIDGLDFMTQDKERKYTFTELYKDSYDTESTTAGYVKREGKDPANGTYHICYRDDNNFSNFSDSEMGKAWHETVHLTRMLEEHDIPYREWAKTGGRQSNDGIIGYLMGPNDRLSCCTENIHHEEYAAYRSQQLVFPNSMPTPVGCVFGSIKTDTELNQYIKNNY
ncbi:MAG TPA: hypothetical protein PKH58_13320, partial [Paludibacteraceae bacterium]|nr:hypothetical protein [Paludibacteraceae bacterium]